MMRKPVLVLGMLLALGQLIWAQPNTIVETIPFTLTSHNNISIKAVFGGIDTLDLMFHTAANSVTLTKKASEGMKSIQWNSEGDATSWGGKSTMRYSESNTVEIGKLHWDSVGVWEDKNSGPGTDGKFGPNLFEGYVIEIDFDQNLLILLASLPDKADGFTKMPLQTENGSLFIQGKSTIGGVDFTNLFMIHSGYGGALLFDDKFAAKRKVRKRIEIIDEKELKDSFGNVIKVQKGLLPAFALGEIELTAVPVGFFQGKIGRQRMSVIGGDVLKRFNILINSDRTFIYLQANQLTDIAYTQF